MVLKRNEILFETSWEVCNMVGGIHTVISSKIDNVLENFEKDKYFLIGPWLDNSTDEFIEMKIPRKFKKVYDELKDMGIIIHFGKWNVNKNKPQVILVEYLGYRSHIDDIKGKIWEIGKVDSLGSNWYDFDEVMLWSWSCGIVIEKIGSLSSEKKLVHSHEWMSGGVNFYIKSRADLKNNFKTIFTTHATMLGRALCGNGRDIYNLPGKFNAELEADNIGVKTKFQTERALSKISDCFTTVSDITAGKAKKFFGKKVDVLLYNGFDNEFKNDSQRQKIQKKSRDKLNKYLVKHFEKYYNEKIDLANTRLIYTSGRNEFTNKGCDLLIDSMGDLNKKLAGEKSKNDVIGLVFVPIGEFKIDNMLISTHRVAEDNEFIRAINSAELFNKKDDKVKIVLVPVYLSKKDGILNQDYYDYIKGCDLGIFPSYYEPWGYTPLESIAYGVPTVTSDVAGFGRAYLENFQNKNNDKSIIIIKREKKNYDKSREELFLKLVDFVGLSEKQLDVIKKRSYILSKKFSWSEFYKNYLKAYDFSLGKK